MPPNNPGPNQYVPPPAPPPIVPQQPQQPNTGPGQPAPDYNFIMQPPSPGRRGPNLSGFMSNSSLGKRIAVIGAGLFILLIIFLIARSIFSGGGNSEALTTVGQQQQSIIHTLETGPGDNNQQVNLSESTQNLAATTQASITSAQQQLLLYMKNNRMKVGTKELAAKINPATDEQLKTAASNSTYETTFLQVMRSQLQAYEKSLKTAYQETSGPKGRQLLQDQYNGAELLLKQLPPDTSSSTTSTVTSN